ncbi:aminopeptidase [Treponema sp.]|uniref:aminopeptidase n=1 Tax=Treponema sp. TaxID=166 RepID=UPI003F0DD9DD
MDIVENYKKFLAEGKTERECVSQIIQLAEKNGYKNIDNADSLHPGEKVYVCKRNKSIALFHIGTGSIEDGMNILGAHIDSPRLDVKQNPLYEKDFIVYLNTHYYGGIKKYQWVALPLALHGVVCLKDGSTVRISIGEKPEDPVFCISDILPHLAQKQMKEIASEFISGENLDVICGSTLPLPENSENKEKNKAKKAVLDILKESYGIEEKDFYSAEFEVVPAGEPRDLGFDRSLILAYGQDDRSCAYTSAQAMMDVQTASRTMCCICVDKEEIGSYGATGMGSHFMENAVAEVVARLGAYSELSVRRCLNNSCMLSSDVNSAYDPLNSDLFDKDNASFLGGGLVFQKYTGSRGKSGASDADPEFIAKLRNILDAGNVAYQFAELGKVDQGGGGTIAHLAAKYGMYVIDAGVAVLAMHAPWEITSKEDIRQAYKGYKLFLEMS